MDWSEMHARLRHNEDDFDAWAALQRNVRLWARRDLWERGWDVIEDLVAEACASAVLAIDRARGAETFAGFVRGHYLNARRRALTPEPIPTVRIESLATPIALAEPIEDERWAILDQCLDTLPERESVAVRLRYFEEASAEQIAHALQVTTVNARRIVFNGDARLRQCVAKVASPS